MVYLKGLGIADETSQAVLQNSQAPSIWKKAFVHDFGITVSKGQSALRDLVGK